MITVWEAIQELSKYDPDTEISFEAELYNVKGEDRNELERIVDVGRVELEIDALGCKGVNKTEPVFYLKN